MRVEYLIKSIGDRTFLNRTGMIFLIHRRHLLWFQCFSPERSFFLWNSERRANPGPEVPVGVFLFSLLLLLCSGLPAEWRQLIFNYHQQHPIYVVKWCGRRDKHLKVGCLHTRQGPGQTYSQLLWCILYCNFSQNCVKREKTYNHNASKQTNL